MNYNIAFTSHRDDSVDLLFHRVLQLVDLRDLRLLEVAHTGDLLAHRKVERLVYGRASVQGVEPSREISGKRRS